ncbi:hypothetical protein [Vibrio phage BONAISHI]|nr:hypothetical protein [Vibrio phage BONAISHI]
MNPVINRIIKRGLDDKYPEFGDILDLYNLYGTRLTANHYLIAALGRGSNDLYGDVSNIEYGLHNYTNNQLLVVSIGLGSEETVKDVSHLSPHTNCINNFRSDANFNSIPFPMIHEYIKD